MGLNTGEHIQTLEGHAWGVNTVALTPDNRYIISGSGDRTLRLWDLEAVTLTDRTSETQIHTSWISCVATIPGRQYAVSGSGDHTLRMWDLKTGAFIQHLIDYKDIVENIVNVKLGNRQCILFCSRDRTLKLWDLNSYELLKIMRGHTSWVCTAAIIPPESDNLSRYAISGAYDCTLRLWDLESGECLRTFEGHSEPVLVVKVTPDGRYAISGSRDRTLIVWEIKIGKLLHTLEGHTSWVVDLAITSDSQYVVSGSHDCTLRLWDLKTGKCLRTFAGHEDKINTLAITKDDRFVISGSGDPRSRRTTSGVIDHTLRRWDLWNRDNSQPVETFRGHQEGINQIMITPDGNHVVSVSQDHSLRLWKMNSGGQCVAKFFGDAEISCFDIVDDRLFVAGAGNGALHILELKD